MKRYTKRVQLKICVDCASPKLATTRRCEDCNIKHRTWRSQYNKSRLASGMCLRCVHKAKPGRTMCEVHLLEACLRPKTKQQNSQPAV